MRALIPALGTGAMTFFLLAGGSYLAAKQQAREPRRPDGEGGIYQRFKQRELRQSIGRHLRFGSFLTLVATAVYLLK